MNSVVFNGAVANGASQSPFTQGSATVTGSASLVVADINFIIDASSAATATAEVTAVSVCVLSGVATLKGTAGFFPVATRTSALAATIGASAEVQPFVTRDVPASAGLAGAASLSALLSDALGYSTAAATAEVTADAVCTQFGTAAFPASTADIPAPEADRIVGGIPELIEATATFGGIDAKVNNLFEPVLTFDGSATVVLNGDETTALAGAIADQCTGTADLDFDPTVIQYGSSALTGTIEVTFDGQVIVSAVTQTIGASLEATAVLTIIKPAEATATAEARLLLSEATQFFQTTLDAITVAAEVTADSARMLAGAVNFPTTADIAAVVALRNLKPVATLDASAAVVLDEGTITTPATAEITFGTAESTATGSRVAMTTAALEFGTAEVTATASAVLLVDAAVNATAESISTGLRVLSSATDISADTVIVIDQVLTQRILRSTVLVVANAVIAADSRTNPEAFDPDERTFIRPPYLSDFVRPPYTMTFARPTITTSFGRAA